MKSKTSFLIYYLYFLGLFIINGHADTNSPISMQLKLPSSISSKSHISLVIEISNSSSSKQTLSLELNLPSQWKSISSSQAIHLQAKSKQTVFKTIYVPSEVQSDLKHTITVHARSPQKDIYSSQTISVQVNKRIDARLTWEPSTHALAWTGSKYTQKFHISNTGNTTHTFTPQAISTIPWHIRIDPPSILLKPKATASFKAIVKVPKNFKQEILHQFHVEIPHITPKIKSNKASMRILPKIKNREYYEQAEIQIKHHLSGLGTGTQLTPQTDIHLSGKPSKTSFLDAYYQGPFYGEEDRINAKSIGQEKFRLHYETPNINWHWGDHSLTLSELIDTQQGRGHFMQWHPQKQAWDISALNYQEETGLGLNTDHTSTQINYQIRPFWMASYTYSEEEDTWSSFQGTTPQKRRFQSLGNTFELGSLWSLSYELAHSQNKDYAHSSEINYQGPKWEQSLSYVDSGSQFEGPWSNIKRYQYFSRYNVNSKLAPYISYTHKESSTQELNDISTPQEDTYEIGNQLNSPFWGHLFNSYVFSKTQETQSSSSTQTTSKTSSLWTSNWSKSIYEWITISLRGTLSTQEQHSNQSWGSSIALSHYPFAVSLMHDSNLSETDGSDTKSQQQTLNISYQLPHPNITIDSSFTINHTKETEDDSDHHLQVSVQYHVNSDHSIRLELEKRDSNQTDTLGKWRGYLTWQRKFYSMIPWRPRGGRIEGRIYVDLNHNDIYDQQDQAISGAVIRSGSFKAISNANGEYSLRGLPPGQHFILLEPSSFPIDLSPVKSFPHQVNISDNKTIAHTIKLQKTIKTLSGTVLKVPSQFDWEHTAPFPYPNIRINLLDANEQLFKVAFTEQNGSFTFHNIPYGQYRIAPDPNSISSKESYQSNQSLEIQLKENVSPQDIEIKVFSQEKPIQIKKF